MKLIFSLLAIVMLCGCLGYNSARIKGGSITSHASTGAVITQQQSADPKSRSTLVTSSEKTSELIIPAGSVFLIPSPVSSVDVTSAPVKVIMASNSTWRVISKDTVSSGLGAAQANTLGDTIAKLSSLKWLTYVGVVLFLFGVATAVYPPLKLIVGGSMTTSAAIAGAGLALTFLPVLVVGHELLILGVALGGVGLYWFAHRHGTLKGELTAVKDALTTKTDTTATDTKTEA